MRNTSLACLTFALLIINSGKAFAQCTATTLASGPTTYCAGSTGTVLSVSGYSASCVPATYIWQTKSGSSWINLFPASSSTFTPSATGYYRCHYTTGSSVVVNSDSIYITVNPVPAIVVSPHLVAICIGGVAQLCPTISPSTTYQWYNGTVPIAGATSACYFATSAGKYACLAANSFGCTAFDTSLVMVVGTPSSPTVTNNGPVCAGDTLRLTAAGIFANPGYNWSGPNGFTSTLQNPKLATTGASAGTYQLTISGSGCAAVSAAGSTTPVITCLDSVWPGDVNYDKVADNFDVLDIALALGSGGFVRTNATTIWQPEHCRNWAATLPGLPAINRKHADCDGNGTVTMSDTLAVTANYGLTHLKRIPAIVQKVAGLPDLYFDMTGITPTPGKTITVPIKLGSSASPMQSFYGIATRIMIDGITPVTTPLLSYTGSWLGNGTNTLRFSRGISQNRLDWTYVRTDHYNSNGNGTLAALTLTIPANVGGQ